MNIREATTGDLEKLEYFQELMVTSDREFDDSLVKEEKIVYYDIQKLLASDLVKFLVVEENSKIVGTGFGQIQENSPWSINKKRGFIGLVFIEKAYRGRGLSKQVVMKLLDWFRERQIKEVRLDTYATNTTALHVYEQCGFAPYEVVMRCVLK